MAAVGPCPPVAITCHVTLLCIRAPVQVGVSNLSARGTVRIAIKPLLDELPVAGGVKVGGDVWPWWPHTMVATHYGGHTP